MDQFDFEELVADMLDITDDQKDEDDSIVEDQFFEKFGMDLEQGYELAKALLPHVPPVMSELKEKPFHAFLSKSKPFMLMKMEVNKK